MINLKSVEQTIRELIDDPNTHKHQREDLVKALTVLKRIDEGTFFDVIDKQTENEDWEVEDLAQALLDKLLGEE